MISTVAANFTQFPDFFLSSTPESIVNNIVEVNAATSNETLQVAAQNFKTYHNDTEFDSASNQDKIQLHALINKIRTNRKLFLLKNSISNIESSMERALLINEENWKESNLSEKILHFSIQKLKSKLDFQSDSKDISQTITKLIKKIQKIQNSKYFKKTYTDLQKNFSPYENDVIENLIQTFNQFYYHSSDIYSNYANTNTTGEIFNDNRLTDIKTLLITFYIDQSFNGRYFSILHPKEILSFSKSLIYDIDWPETHPYEILKDFFEDELAHLIFLTIRHKEGFFYKNNEEYSITNHFKMAYKISNDLENFIYKLFLTDNNLNFSSLDYTNLSILYQAGKTFYEVCEQKSHKLLEEKKEIIKFENSYINTYGYENWLFPTLVKPNSQSSLNQIDKTAIYNQIAYMMNQNIVFKIGSVEYAKAIALQLIDKWQLNSFIPEVNINITDYQFNLHRKNFLRASENYPIDPLYFFSSNIAESNGVFFEIKNSHQSTKHKARDNIYKEILNIPYIDRVKFINDLNKNNFQIDNLLEKNIEVNSILIPDNIKQVIKKYNLFLDKYIVLKKDGMSDLLKSLLEFGQAKILAKMMLPKFDSFQVILDSLKLIGLTSEEIKTNRNVDLKVKIGPTLRSVTHKLNPFEEVYIRSFILPGINEIFSYANKNYQIAELVGKGIKIFFNKIKKNPIIIAYARLALYEAKANETPEILKKYINKIIIENYSYDLNLHKSVILPKNKRDKPKEPSITNQLTKGFLVSPSLVEIGIEISSLIEKKDWSKLIKMIPIIGSIQTIGEGLSKKDALETMEGTISLCVDILFLLIDKKILNSTEKIFSNEQAELINFKNQIDIEEKTLNSNFKFLINSPNYLISRVKMGEKNVKWKTPNNELVNVELVEDLDEVLPLKVHSEADRRYVVLDWNTGERRLDYHFIDKVRSVVEGKEKFFSRSSTGLMGGNNFKKLLNYDVRGTTVKRRSALSQLYEDFMEADFANTYHLNDFKYHLRKLFQNRASNEEEKAMFSMLENDIKNRYKHSATFRFYFNNYVLNHSKHKPYSVIFQEFGHPFTDFKNKIIQLPLPKNLENLKYVSVSESSNGKAILSTPTLQQVYLHEILHAITSHTDLLKENPFLERGPIIALESRIYYELGEKISERIVYRADINPINNAINLKEESIIAAWYENKIIDYYFNKFFPFKSKYRSTEFLFGEKINERPSIDSYMQFTNRLVADNFNDDFNHFFKNNYKLFPFENIIFEQRDYDFIAKKDNSIFEVLDEAFQQSHLFRNSYKNWLYLNQKSTETFAWKVAVDF